MVFRPDRSPLASRYLTAAFVLCLTAILYLSLAPSEATPAANLGWDKARHALAYFVLTGLGLFTFGPRLFLLGGVVLLGAGVEIAQAAMNLGRQGDLVELAANLTGEGVALGIWTIMTRLRRRRRARSA
jgi:VanZ family protein